MGLEARKTCEGEAQSRLISLELPVMMGGFLRSRHSLRPLLVNAGESHKRRNVLGAIPRRERGEVQAELDGIWSQPTKPEAVAQLAIFKAKYSKRYRGSGEKSG